MLISITPEAVMLALEALGLVDKGNYMEVVAVHVDHTYGHAIGIHLTGASDDTPRRNEGAAPLYKQTVTRYDVWHGLRGGVLRDREVVKARQAGPWGTPDWARTV